MADTTLKRARRDAAVCRAFLSGMSPGDIASALELSESVVVGVLKRAGELQDDDPEPPPVEPDSVNAALVCHIAAFHEKNGFSFLPVAAALDAAEHASHFGCGNEQCERLHTVTLRRAGRYRSRSFAPAPGDTCECGPCRAKVQAAVDRRERDRQRQRRWYQTNHARAREAQRRYRESHHDDVLATNRRWKAANKKRRSDYNREYVEANRARIREYQNERNRQRRQAANEAAEASPQSNAAPQSPPAAYGGYGQAGETLSATNHSNGERREQE